MPSPKLIDALPRLEAEGLITAEQAERIRARYAGAAAQGAGRMLLLFAILGSLLMGLGIILIVAHNWDDLSRPARTALAIAPVAIGQALALLALRKGPDARAWREGSALLLACALCACVALIGQIYHIEGSMDGYLLTCALLILPLLYLPGSIVTALGFLALATWHAGAYRFGHPEPDARPFTGLALLIAAAPCYLREARLRGASIVFWWLSLFMALSTGLISQWLLSDWSITHAFGLLAMASAFALAPWLHADRALRSWPWALVGGATVLIAFLVLSYREPWGFDHAQRAWTELDTGDAIALAVMVAIGLAAYALALKRRKPFERWPYPEALGFFTLCYVAGMAEPWLAPLLVNIALIVMGVVTVRAGIASDSLRRMNLGLAIIGLTATLRFLDADMSYAARGLAFIAIGGGFLLMNLRMVRARDKRQDAS